MSKKRNLCKAYIVVIACLTVIMMFSMTSVARDFVETDRKCTLDLTSIKLLLLLKSENLSWPVLLLTMLLTL